MIAKKRKKFRIIFNYLFFSLGAISVFFLLFIVHFINNYEQSFNNKIFSGVYIDKTEAGNKTKAEIINDFSKKTLSLKNKNITILFNQEAIATFSAETLNLKYDGETASVRAYLIGRSSNKLSAYLQIINSLLGWQKYYFDSEIEYDKSVVKDLINSAEEKYNQPAKNALFKFESGKVISFHKEKPGLKINSEELLSNFDKTIQQFKKQSTDKIIVLTSTIIQPEITLSQINSFGIEEELAVGKSNFSHSIATRVDNIILASSKFNGVLIPPKRIFSFNETVGDISSLTGYQPAYIIKEGKTVLGDGGGVCQVSTTLFRAALNAGLPIVERHAHAYRVSYYENDSQPGFDATVFAPSVDLKIKNDTGNYILIQTEVDKDNNLLFFKLYGKKDNRRSEISNVLLWDVSSPPPAIYQDDPTLKRGVTKQIDFPAWGGKASFNYKVYKDDQLIIDEKYYSSYKPWQAVYLVGTAD
ncbi:hypothetical protein COW98_00350 [Candidatus Roizmanbacteria bacterium CG22_combo_CG10-13_8_21_14_all_35_9]|uniref:YoaR-like putative peptidoglycan binding domain-containing protein n=4 Tax=Candidatus Roizmaniibacteriota TaxID=1752723 RepID=A0A2M8F4Q4_9BACT|nr:MAG: hypothetical protein COX47_00770 [Candidatus Roizmanbacteria bacterium CG23_combo_of_CG06-09_8_20_14_all_35_49]PIP63115.1 MAG: hypothetical protein COW98_00350 [Candidatus Roizmanbacteria bacterium CG22_combo_CG10-13_8_21_14_all_35_9]PIY70777.1 MAG: hypothetical protein COY88_03790 [Candidatus Roizmanbacteria bacterium CG_4_10_14_0_8_um_filter_35_28]PJC34284.1 MAG: hypothetical protein CO048_00815 [Candidatus Roizmanbacteria bacterium CG_4_9_14_0_2_um_filter_35_15]PJC82349.1 MAG: hypoth